MDKPSRGGGGSRDGGGGGKDGRRRSADFFMINKDVEIDYKNADVLRRFLSPEGKILPSRRTGLSAKHQRKVARAIKTARSIGLLPFTNHDA